MFRVVVLAVVLTVVSADVDESREKCKKLAHPETLKCCKDEIKGQWNGQGPKDKSDVRDDIKECFDIPKNGPDSCEHDICIGKKRGFASDDGTLDKDAFVKVFSEEFNNVANLVESVTEKCVNGDLELYGPPAFCVLTKLKHCVNTQAVNGCKVWDDSGSCAGTKDLVQECAKLMA